MKLSKQGFDLINHFETGGDPSRYLKAYWDRTGRVWTIGIGQTVYPDGRRVKEGDVITLQQAYDFFRGRIGVYEKDVGRMFRVSLSQHQFDALVSLKYNSRIRDDSSLVRAVNGRRPLPELAAIWFRYVHSGGKVLDGLKWRRASEFYLFCTGRFVSDRIFLKKLYESRAVELPPSPGPGSGGALLAVLLAVAFFFLVH